MKTVIACAVSLLMITAAVAAPGASLQQKFNETFPNSKNVKWSDDKNGFYVSFTQNGNFKKAFYNKDGDFVCSWKYTDGSDLPISIVIKLNKKFEGSKILGVTEYTAGENMLYNVKLSKGEKLYNLDILSDGTIARQQKFNTQVN